MEPVIRPGAEWKPATPDGFTDVRYETSDGIAKITICRPEVRNAFRPRTLFELRDAFEIARDDPEVGVVLFTVKVPTRSAPAATSASAATTGTATTKASAA
jgi:1,4-dihydroxy-2-naphthoyl-CoA synthase